MKKKIMNEFKINKYITLKLQNGKTSLYVDGKYFSQCMQLMLNIPKKSLESDNFTNINSIDEIANTLKTTEENFSNINNNILPEQEFQAHCSNIQAWAENNYDTRILHSNIAFPLLKRLTEVGDLIAKKVFKNEIVERFSSGLFPVSSYLIEENYLNYLTIEEQVTLIESMNIKGKNLSILTWIVKKNLYHYFDENFISRLGDKNEILDLRLIGIELSQWPRIFENLPNLEKLNLDDNKLTFLPESIGSLTSLRKLYLRDNLLTQLPEFIGNLTQLKILNVRENQISDLPEFIGNLTQLTELYFCRNKLIEIPESSIENLSQLEILHLHDNQLIFLPECIGKLTSLKILSVHTNQLIKLPESIGKLISLGELYVWDNQLTTLPASIGNLQNLERLHLKGNQLTRLPESIWNLFPVDYGKRLLQLGKHKQAMKKFQKSLEIRPEFKKNWINLVITSIKMLQEYEYDDWVDLTVGELIETFKWNNFEWEVHADTEKIENLLSSLDKEVLDQYIIYFLNLKIRYCPECNSLLNPIDKFCFVCGYF